MLPPGREAANIVRACRSFLHSPPPRNSVFSALAGGAHLHELRIEPAEDLDQIGLRGHNDLNVLIDAWHFIETGGEQFDTAFSKQLPWRAQGEGLQRFRATNHAAGAMRRRVQGFGRTLAPYDVTR